MRHRLIVSSWIVFVGTTLISSAGDLPILIVSENGYAWMIQDETGKPVLYQFSQVIVLGKPSTKSKPIPSPEPSEFGLETQAKAWMLTVPDAARGNTAAIAKALTDNAALGKSGEFSTIGQMEAALAVLLANAITDKPAWAGFGASLQASLSTLKSPTVGKIKTPDDLGRALLEVARGMQL